MKIIFLIASFFLLQTSHAQNNDEQVIRKALQVQMDAWNKGDLETFMSTYWNSDSLKFIGKSGVTYGWKPTLENYKKSYPDKESMGTLEFDLIEVKRLSVLYFHVIGKWHLKRSENKGDLSGHFTLLFKKIKQKWVIICDHSS